VDGFLLYAEEKNIEGQKAVIAMKRYNFFILVASAETISILKEK